MSAGGEPPLGGTPSHRQESGYGPPSQPPMRAHLPAGATVPLDDMTYPQIYQHSQQLGRLARWDGRGLFAGAGVLALGAGLGALAAGTPIDKIGVLLCLAIGVILLIGALFIKRANIVSARDLKISFDQGLTLYETVKEIREMREHFDTQLPPAPQTWWERCRHFLNV